MNYREAVKAYQGLVKRGALDPNDYRQPGYNPETNTYYTPIETSQPVAAAPSPAPMAEAPVVVNPAPPSESQAGMEEADMANDQALEKQQQADAEKALLLSKIKRYARVGRGALVGGAGAGLLSYLLAPKMSGLGRFLTVTGGATAGGAAAHYGPGVIEDITNWLAARRAGKQTPNEAAQRDNMQTMHASNMTPNEAAMRSNQKKLTGK